MPDPENARDLFEPLPDVDPADATDASSAADDSHEEVDELAEDADADGAGHGPASSRSDAR